MTNIEYSVNTRVVRFGLYNMSQFKKKILFSKEPYLILFVGI